MYVELLVSDTLYQELSPLHDSTHGLHGNESHAERTRRLIKLELVSWGFEWSSGCELDVNQGCDIMDSLTPSMFAQLV